MRYFITFTCYGAHLHGDEIGSVERNHNVFGNRWAEPNRAGAEGQTRANQAPCFLEKGRRAAVMAALRRGCSHRGWIPERKRWARHGSTRWLWKGENSRKRFGMSFRGRVNLWKSTWESCCSVPLLLVAAQFFSGALEIPYTHISNRLSKGFTAFFACFPLPLRLGALPVSSASNAFWKSSLVAA